MRVSGKTVGRLGKETSDFPFAPALAAIYTVLMNRFLLAFAALSLPTVAGAAAVGGFFGSDTGIFYMTSRSDYGRALRLSLYGNIPSFNLATLSNSSGLGAGVDYLKDIRGTENLSPLRLYSGLGLNAVMTLGGEHHYGIYPHGLAGMEYNISSQLSAFFEGNAGPMIGFGDNKTGFGLHAGARVGIIRMLGR